MSVNEDVGSLQLTLSRTESSPVTVLVRIMTLDQFAARDTSVSGTCEEDLTIVGLDPAEGKTQLSLIAVKIVVSDNNGNRE